MSFLTRKIEITFFSFRRRRSIAWTLGHLNFSRLQTDHISPFTATPVYCVDSWSSHRFRLLPKRRALLVHPDKKDTHHIPLPFGDAGLLRGLLAILSLSCSPKRYTIHTRTRARTRKIKITSHSFSRYRPIVCALGHLIPFVFAEEIKDTGLIPLLAEMPVHYVDVDDSRESYELEM